MDTNPFTESTTHLSLVTIVAEAILEQRLIRELKGLGVSGFTASMAHGQGSRGSRAGDLEGGNVKIETIVQPALAAEIMAHMESHYFEYYAVIVWVSEVGVLRGDKYL